MGQALKRAMKIVLLLTGSVMLLGGGFCVATNLFFAIPSMFQQAIMLYLVLMSISALIAWLGWKLSRKPEQMHIAVVQQNHFE